MEFYPIINLNLGETVLSYEDTAELYKNIIDVFLEYKESHKDSAIKKLEFSFASSQIIDHMDLVLEAVTKHPDKFCFGSLVAVDVLEKHVRHCEERSDEAIPLRKEIATPSSMARNDGTDTLEMFAPAFDDEIYKYLANTAIDYIPGIFCKEDFQELQTKNLAVSKVKIFPMEARDPMSFLRSLQAPYPELKQANILKRVFTVDDELAKKYNLYEKSKTNLLITTIETPRDYQRIRKQFLEDKSLKLLLKPKAIHVSDLVKFIKESNSALNVIVTGFGKNLADLKHLEQIGVDAIATRVFRNIVLDLLAGTISLAQAKSLMLQELDISASLRGTK